MCGRAEGGIVPGPRPPTNTGPIMIDAYQLELEFRIGPTTTTNCRVLYIIVVVRPNFYSALCLAMLQFSSPFNTD